MPELKLLRLAMDRIKNLGKLLTIRATNGGRFTLAVDTYNVKCNVKFSELRTFETGGMSNFYILSFELFFSLGLFCLYICCRCYYCYVLLEKNDEQGEAFGAPAVTVQRDELNSEREFCVEVDMKCIQNLVPTENIKPTSFICSMFT